MGKWIALAFVAGCATNPPASDPAVLKAQAQTTFDNSIYPLLLAKCSGNTGGCHSDSYGLILEPSISVAYQTALEYVGDYTASAPILTHHTSSYGQLSSDATATIEAWLAQEQAANEP